MQLSVEVDPASVRTESVQDGPPVPRFEEGRTCEEPGCRTVLSVYNDGFSCWAHRPMERVTPLRNHRRVAPLRPVRVQLTTVSCTVQRRRRVPRRSPGRLEDDPDVVVVAPHARDRRLRAGDRAHAPIVAAASRAALRLGLVHDGTRLREPRDEGIEQLIRGLDRSGVDEDHEELRRERSDP